MIDGCTQALLKFFADTFRKFAAQPIGFRFINLPLRQSLIDAAVVADEEAALITAAITMLHGRNDKPCPADQTTLVVADKLPRADVILLSECGHNLPRERTDDYLAAARALFNPKS